MKKVSSMECSLTCVSISRICHIKNVVRNEVNSGFIFSLRQWLRLIRPEIQLDTRDSSIA